MFLTIFFLEDRLEKLMEIMAQFASFGPLEPWAWHLYGIIMLTMAFGLALNLKKPEKSE